MKSWRYQLVTVSLGRWSIYCGYTLVKGISMSSMSQLSISTISLFKLGEAIYVPRYPLAFCITSHLNKSHTTKCHDMDGLITYSYSERSLLHVHVTPLHLQLLLHWNMGQWYNMFILIAWTQCTTVKKNWWWQINVSWLCLIYVNMAV